MRNGTGPDHGRDLFRGRGLCLGIDRGHDHVSDHGRDLARVRAHDLDHVPILGFLCQFFQP